jgi:alkylation response protein AidB-like acyl-CoA dehydrogenase
VAFGHPVVAGRHLLIDGQAAAQALVWTTDCLMLVDLADVADRQAADGLDGSLHYNSVRLTGCNVLARVDTKSAIAQRARVLTAAMLLGISHAVRDMAAEYANLREQFGKPIGAFQAIKHSCADMVVQAEAAQAQVLFAAASITGGRPDAGFQSIAAKIIATQAAYSGARHNIQIHGAMGFTVECDAHWFLKRTHVLDQLGGSLRSQLRQLLACR